MAARGVTPAHQGMGAAKQQSGSAAISLAFETAALVGACLDSDEGQGRALDKGFIGSDSERAGIQATELPGKARSR